MEIPAEPGKTRDTGKMLQVLMVALIIVGAGLVGYVLYQRATAANESTPSTPIKAGDLVTMNYIGRLPNGNVFDTSLLSVAHNNALYPKSLTFSTRANNTYVPFNMTAGAYGAGGTIKGFALGVIGLHVGDDVVIDVKPGEGYPVNPAQLKWSPLTEQLTVLDHLTVEEFQTTFNSDPVQLQIYQHPFWKWDLQVISVDGDFVVIKELPSVGQVVYPFGNPNAQTNPQGWPVTVESYDPTANGGLGIIEVRHVLVPADAFSVKGTDLDGQTVIVEKVNLDNGTFLLGKNNSETGYNAELAGTELFFQVMIIKVEAA